MPMWTRAGVRRFAAICPPRLALVEQAALCASSPTSAMTDTFKAHRKRLLSGVMLDALEVEEGEKQAESPDVEHLLQRLDGLPWEPAVPVGEGEELRASSEEGDNASALLFDDVLVHGSVVLETT